MEAVDKKTKYGSLTKSWCCLLLAGML